jgi:uncharacterized protein (TIGR02646 family)
MQRALYDLQTDLAALPEDSTEERQKERVDRARESFNALEKSKLRAVLYGEQHHLCVYCERRVKEANTPPIEHWRPVKHAPHHALSWDNLYLSCPTEGTCDDAKNEQQLALPWPTEKPYERAVGFTSGGEIYVRTDAPLTPADHQALEFAICKIVKLNHDALVEARKAAIDAEMKRLARTYPGRHLEDAERAAEAQRVLAAPKREPFASIRVAYLEDTLGDGRP